MYDVLQEFNANLNEQDHQTRIRVVYDGIRVEIDISTYVDDVWKIYAHWGAKMLHAQVKEGKQCY